MNATPLLLAVAAAFVASEVLRFGPPEGATVERTATWTEETEAVDVRVSLDGEDTSEVPTVRTTVRRTLTVESEEEFVRCADGHLLELVRRFGPITMEATADVDLETLAGVAELTVGGEGSSLLEDVGVRFTWDAESEEWEKGFADDYDADVGLLEGLEPTTEFLAVLPEKEDVEVGDRWNVPLDALLDVLRPGGEVPLDVETDLAAIEGVLDPIRLPGVLESLDGVREGDVVAVVRSLEDGTAVVEVTVDASVVCDQLARDAIDIDDALPEGVRAELRRFVHTTSIDGEGELVWDLEGNRMASFRFEADVEVEVEMEVDVEVDGLSHDYVMREVRDGTLRVEVE